MKKYSIALVVFLLLAGAVYFSGVIASGLPDANLPPAAMPDINGEREPDINRENEGLFLVGADPIVAVADWAMLHRVEPGVYRTSVAQADIYLISAGEKPTAGYSVRVNEIGMHGDRWVIDFTVEPPGKEEMVAQVVTFPTELVYVHQKGLNVAFRQIEGETITEMQVTDTESVEN